MSKDANNGANKNIGDVKISEEVISTIAGVAATEVDGVVELSGSVVEGLASKLGSKKSKSKGIKVEMSDEGTSVDVYIVINYGTKIPDLAWAIQENVKNNIENITGLTVLKVDVHIEGVIFPKEEPQKPEESPAEEE